MPPRAGSATAPLRSNDLSSIRVQGARENNLKNVDLTIPRDAMVVLQGYRDLVNLHLLLTPSSQRDSAGTLNHYLRTHVCSLGR